MNELYPIKFTPQLKEKIWGGQHLKEFLNKPLPKNKTIGESWEISGVEGSISVAENGFLQGNNLQELIEIYMGDLVGDRVYDQFGIEFPLLIKFIDANDVLSIQVHPDDQLAKERHNAFGKTEMWYIVHARENATLISGFNKKIDQTIYTQHLASNELPKILNYEKVKQGDVFFIPSGRVHAIGKGIVLAEIQQTSDITYRIFDWNRKDDQGKLRELHTDLALDAIDFTVYDHYKTSYNLKINNETKVLNCKYFHTNIIHFNQPMEKDYNQLDSFVVYLCIEGKFIIHYTKNNNIMIQKGETVLIPAVFEHLSLEPVEESKILEIFIPEAGNESNKKKKN
ncbi:MAG: type I phosphomannose isomerase catalytic subunit [Bacteroidales bacterium]|jgi:mannose-6-phosphate isomerase|nr:type I phosphomannose isomerase catalytic subunit [Bacteroidales bacterium]